MVRAHQYDALVGIAGCDKSLPGTMMAMARLNIPSVFVYGGTIMPGMLDGKELTIVDVYEAVGAYDSGKISIDDLKDFEKTACPSAGSILLLNGIHDIMAFLPGCIMSASGCVFSQKVQIRFVTSQNHHSLVLFLPHVLVPIDGVCR